MVMVIPVLLIYSRHRVFSDDNRFSHGKVLSGETSADCGLRAHLTATISMKPYMATPATGKKTLTNLTSQLVQPSRSYGVERKEETNHRR
ncbi:Uu.00g038480.m01.CDS01 [Anthostomella pinea]|uniref:Uu.00g038480.m01.CDS01 n=1 Tax=Anthostomella pinea TaxID=933095 RepID=A0AAI8VAT7_9PEZI|nr:Uu.00g038480.m01.CDS01 [Anthostomella pinea]